MFSLLLFSLSSLCEAATESSQSTSSQVGSVQGSSSESSLSTDSSSTTSSYSFDDYDFSALKRAKFVLLLCSLCLFVYHRDDPYNATMEFFGLPFPVLFNVFDTFTSYQGLEVDDSHCIFAMNYGEELSCIALNHTERTTFSSDGKNITSTCLLSILRVSSY